MKMTGAQTQMLKGIITNPNRPELQGVFKQGDFWIATDRMSIFYLKKKPNLPICQGCDQNLVDLLDTPLSAREIKLPSIDFMVGVQNKASCERKHILPYELDAKAKVFISPKFMVRMMKVLPDVTVAICTTPKKPIVFYGFGDDYGVIFPMMHSDNSPYINHEGELINPNLGEEIIKEEDECNSIKTVMSM